MKYNRLTIAICCVASILAVQCSPMKQTPQAVYEKSLAAASQLHVELKSQTQYALGNSILVEFTVKNPTKKKIQFTQYHTPFEGFVSTFLSVTDSEGNEVPYIGAMAKRVMPPSANSYITLSPGKMKTVSFDLKRGYQIAQPGVYTLHYKGGTINGLAESLPLLIEVVDDQHTGINQTLIIMLKPEYPLADMVKKAEAYGAEIIYQYEILKGLAIRIPKDKSVQAALLYFEKLEGVAAVSKDEISTIN